MAPGAPPTSPRSATVIALVARLTVQEAVRGRSGRALLAIAVALLTLFALACAEGMDAARRAGGTATEDVTGATLLGTAAFAGLLLGAVVAVFLGHAAVRGDAERGMLQPLVVRPVGRGTVVLGRLVAAASVAGAFVAVLWGAAVAVLRVAGGWAPAGWAASGLWLVAAVALVALVAVALSTVLPAMGAGIATLALVGLGFTVGLIAQLAAVLDLSTLTSVSDGVAAILPFEALYRHVLWELSAGSGDLAALGLATGPFGGAREAEGWYALWIPAWAALVGALTLRRAARIDL